MGLRALSAVAIVAIAVAFSTGASAAPIATGYQARANAACARAQARWKTLESKPVTGDTKSAMAAGEANALSTGLAILDQEYGTLRALQPPPALAADHSRALWGLWRTIAALGTEVKRIRSGVDPVSAQIGASSAISKEWSSAVVAWTLEGLQVCSQSTIAVSFLP